MRCIVLLLSFFLMFSVTHAQEMASGRKNRKFKKNISKQLPAYKHVFKNAARYRFEVVYGKVDLNAYGHRKVTYYQMGRPDIYYYPASLVKLPVALKFLEWTSDQNVNNLVEMHIQPASDSACGQPAVSQKRHYYVKTKEPIAAKDFAIDYRNYCSKSVYDSLWNNHGTIEAGKTIRLTDTVVPINCLNALNEMLSQSDNGFYNLFYEAAGSLPSAADDYLFIPRPFIACPGTYQSGGVHMYLLNEKWKTLPGGSPTQRYNSKMKNQTVGIAQIKAHGDTIKTGRDFSTHNQVPLLALTQMLQELTCPAPGPKLISPYIRNSTRQQLLTALRAWPNEKNMATRMEYLPSAANRTNFLLDPVDTLQHGNRRYYNIIGQAYGFTSDVLYFCDPVEGTEFFLSVHIYTNADEVLNDDKYEYEELAFPLMCDLFKYIYSTEKGRMKLTSSTMLYYPEQR